jgi:hypothetical protein
LFLLINDSAIKREGITTDKKVLVSKNILVIVILLEIFVFLFSVIDIAHAGLLDNRYWKNPLSPLYGVTYA